MLKPVAFFRPVDDVVTLAIPPEQYYRDWIIAMSSSGPAPEYPTGTEQQTPEWAMHLKSIQHIPGT